MGIRTAILLAAGLMLATSSAHAQQPQRGRGDGQRGRGQRGERAPPATYYGGGVWGPGRINPRQGGPDLGRYWRGRYWAPGVGPCWTLMPFVGWTWTCGP